MTSRNAPVGANTRQELFSSYGNNGAKDHCLPLKSFLPSQVRQTSPVGSNSFLFEENGQPLELEHVIGYTGHELHTLHYHPRDEGTYICSMGSALVIGTVPESHTQKFLRRHDEEISVLEISKSGVLMASGQKGSTKRPGSEASVVVWEYSTHSQLYRLLGFTSKVIQLAFSPDDHFLAAAGSDCKLFIWDMKTGEVVTFKNCPKPVNVLSWGAMSDKGRRPTYTVAYAFSSQLIVNKLVYDVGSMQYKLTAYPCSMPSTGLVRDYYCSAVCPKSDQLYAGTIAGELLVFSLDSHIYRCTIPVSSNGILSVCVSSQTGTVFAGSGDGFIKKLLQGSDGSWELTAEIRISGRVVSLSLSPNENELLAGTSQGMIYRLYSNNLCAIEVAESHTAGIKACAFGSTSDIFATISQDGSLRVWSLDDYTVVASAQEKIAGLCVCFVENKTTEFLLSGWADGFIRAYQADSGTKLWEVANAHRGQVLTVAATQTYFISGSTDGSVRVWSSRTREIVQQFNEHNYAVTQVLVDCQQPELIHSCGMDRGIFTYNLIKGKRIVAHQLREGGVTSMSQCTQGEKELVTTSTNGNIQFWDCDVVDAVQQFMDSSRLRINQVTVSPSGRFLACCGNDYLVKVYDLREESLLAWGQGHSDFVHYCTWSPDERQIISVGEDSCICVWNFFGVDT